MGQACLLYPVKKNSVGNRLKNQHSVGFPADDRLLFSLFYGFGGYKMNKNL
jgi:hypothetical protein